MPHSTLISQPGDPDAIARQLIQRAHNNDGLPEMAVGLFFLLCASLIYAQVVFPAGSIESKAAAVAFAVLCPVLCFATPRAIRWVRGHYLIDRSGYVQHKPSSRKEIVTGIGFAVLVAVALFGVVNTAPRSHSWLLAVTGLFGGLLTVFSGRLPRFFIGGALMALAGGVLALAGVSLEIGFTILFGLMGLVALISGCVVFFRLIQQPIEAGE
jgi:hypothetical protein